VCLLAHCTKGGVLYGSYATTQGGELHLALHVSELLSGHCFWARIPPLQLVVKAFSKAFFKACKLRCCCDNRACIAAGADASGGGSIEWLLWKPDPTGEAPGSKLRTPSGKFEWCWRSGTGHQQSSGFGRPKPQPCSASQLPHGV